jgi:hypothetical protein
LVNIHFLLEFYQLNMKMAMKLINLILGIYFLIGMGSCSPGYQVYKNRYQFKSKDGKPDYSNLDYWAAHPWKWDPSDSVPKPLRKQKMDTTIDVFFLHPTMYTTKMKSGKMNAEIDDEELNAKTDYSTILYQASAFNQHARVFAPRFREAHISAYFFKDSAASVRAFNLAYEDIKTAFLYYLQHYNQGRPVIIASHSQGSTHALRLLKEFFDDKPLHQQLVAAYVVGMTIPRNYFKTLTMCPDSVSTGCLCGWRTFRTGYRPAYVEREGGISYVTNPLTWQTDDTYAPRSLHRGSILYAFNKMFTAVTDAQINQDILWVSRPRFQGSVFYRTKNYHRGDINLFYVNLRENITQRVNHYFKIHAPKNP